MTKRMLIDATHAEETRVVVLDGNRLEDFDVETATKKQLKGNIYLAKIVRVEPSLQAAFVEYGGNRHGFLAFGEIHPDYYQIPVADRQRLLEQEAEQARAEEAAEDAAADAAARRTPPATPDAAAAAEPANAEAAVGRSIDALAGDSLAADADAADGVPAPATMRAEPTAMAQESIAQDGEMLYGPEPAAGGALASEPYPDIAEPPLAAEPAELDPADPPPDETPPPETLGGEADGAEEAQERRIPSRYLRNYKIQEVIRRRQIMLVQVVKEERGTKGAALTTYISLAGRYCVLMPNSLRGGGISRKITSLADRRRLKEVMAELDIPKGMGLIVRTAGANRPKAEIKRDCEYLLRLWDDIRETTLRSVAPALIYEEASLIKRAIRDVYSRDIDEVAVDGEEGWRAAHEFMRMLMPTHARKVILWNDRAQPLFAKYQVEAQLDGMLLPTVQLRSGGYLVINQTEALVAIDVNSGRSTRERGIEETALRTNQEAAEEVARQLRLRDLAGLIVIDFIDMESKRHNSMVERRLKEALKNDRARLQVGHISHFGLLEMTRQRLRPSLAETSFVLCPNCGGTGHIRSTESAAIHVLRGIEEEAASRRAAEIRVHAAGPIAMYILNYKRDRLHDIELRYGLRASFEADDALIAPQMRIERLRPQVPLAETPVTIDQTPPGAAPEAEEAEEIEPADAVEAPAEAAGNGAAEDAQTAEENEKRHRRRRRRRRGVARRDDGVMPEGAEQPEIPEPGEREPAYAGDAIPIAPGFAASLGEPAGLAAAAAEPSTLGAAATEPVELPPAEESPTRRRTRRGGRRRRPEAAEEIPPATLPEPEPPISGPTPADPFGGGAFDLFEAIEQAEQTPQPASLHTPPLPLPEAAAETLPAAALAEPMPTIAPTAGLEPALTAPAPAEAEPIPQQAAEPEPEPAPSPEPLVKPIVIGGDVPAVEKKRGWWRR